MREYIMELIKRFVVVALCGLMILSIPMLSFAGLKEINSDAIKLSPELFGVPASKYPLTAFYPAYLTSYRNIDNAEMFEIISNGSNFSGVGFPNQTYNTKQQHYRNQIKVYVRQEGYLKMAELYKNILTNSIK